MRLTFLNAISVLSIAVLAAISAVLGYDLLQDLARWAVAQLRVVQNEMASAIHAIRAGAPGAWLTLLVVTGLYGFFHALGPGHGKFLIGGIGLGVQVSATRLAIVALVSSLAQSLWAIALVYGGFFLLQISAAQVTNLAETFLAPASYLAVAAVGLVLVLRGLRALRDWRSGSTFPQHSHGTCGCRGHGPSEQDISRMTTMRGILAVVAGIAIRPCTGALLLLVIAWQTSLVTAGAAAVITMGLGTAATTVLVAVSSVFARGAVRVSSRNLGVLAMTAPSLQLLSGVVIVGFAVSFLLNSNL